LRISRRATVPGLYLWGFFTPPVAGADFLAAFVANCFRGALPPVDFLAVCLVRAIRGKKKTRTSSKQQSTGVRKIAEMQEVLKLKSNKSKRVNFQELQKPIVQKVDFASENIVSCLLLLLLLLLSRFESDLVSRAVASLQPRSLSNAVLKSLEFSRPKFEVGENAL
jgi:hypothetical protein